MTPSTPDTPRRKPSQRPRYRYIAFLVEEPSTPRLKRNPFIDAVRRTADREGLAESQPWLTRFDGRHGILRVLRGHETEGRRLVEALSAVDHDGRAVPTRLRSLLTSGTIAGLERKVFRGIRLDR